MNSPFMSALAGRAAAGIEGMEEDLAALRQGWADKVATLARDNERLKNELIRVGARSSAVTDTLNAVIRELKAIEADPTTPRLISDPHKPETRRKMIEDLEKSATERLHVSVSQAYPDR